MPTFHYQALDAGGQVVAGEIAAENASQAISQLEVQGLVVESIASAATTLPPARARTPAHTLAVLDIAGEREALRPLVAGAMSHGAVFIPALQAYADELPPGFRRAELNDVLRVLERGDVEMATDALVTHPEYWIPLVSASATSGDAASSLRKFIGLSQPANELRRKWWRAFAYPIFVCALLLAVFVMFSFIVVPVFVPTFMDWGIEIPVLTQVVLNSAAWVTSGQALVVAIVVFASGAALFAFMHWRKSSVLEWLGQRVGRVFGRSMSLTQIACYTADLLEAGIEAPSALRIAALASGQPRLMAAAAGLSSSRATRGAAISPGELSASVEHALQTDMPTTSRVRLLRELGDCHGERAGRLSSWTRGLAAPIAICAVGLLVGILVVAMYLPLVSIISNLTNTHH